MQRGACTESAWVDDNDLGRLRAAGRAPLVAGLELPLAHERGGAMPELRDSVTDHKINQYKDLDRRLSQEAPERCGVSVRRVQQIE